jgi:hypothetical protein
MRLTTLVYLLLAVPLCAPAQAAEEVNVRDFGAVGDGVTDDTTAIQTAITVAGTAGGGVVHLPLGSFRFTNLTIPANITLRGVGLDSTYLKTSTSGTAIQLTTSVSHRVNIIGLTLMQTSPVQGKGIAGTDCYWFSTEFLKVTGFRDNLYFSQSIYHSHKRLFSDKSTNGVNYYGAAGVWNTEWFNNLITFDTCRFTSSTVTGLSVKATEVVLINPDFSGMTEAGAIGFQAYGESSSYPAHGIKIINPYIESTQIAFSFRHASVSIEGGFVQGGSSVPAQKTAIIDANSSIVFWDGRVKDQDYWAYGYRITNSSTVTFRTQGFTGSIRSTPGTSDATSSFLLSEYAEGTFAATLTGCTTSPTVMGTWVRVGKQVTLSVPANNAKSNTTDCTITGLPVSIYPAQDQLAYASVFDTGAEFAGTAYLTTLGEIGIYRGGYGGQFTASGTKGHRPINFSYILK